ncbi:class I SAM-dependent methyltransferase [Shimia thalassica]|uniref:S-adenosyl-L-methionine methyltransferase n=1 Tax=Shimia thalassica TaxID=1715693 RepID=A0A0P1IMS3_9RHOB|nr:class I SAM-dependent methyltransferase [Shimia thalassica]MDP2494244.1 class I SAM-dependent methyltransferase [Shimia thalassica]MDP2520318.1 class I SAM-dependent methyltransferase [Shimia thalassica]MDP2580248.1 class I SAM-dependent methyltransferase [Shimia thalassica]CUK07647.1 S-adenosyl-L-methionine methyltransferase [Shimia thalassica]
MSRLDSMMRRLAAQRDGLEWGHAMVGDTAGDYVDMGLGNGRTYDHLREIAPDRRIWVIDRILQCHPSCVPPEKDFLQGEAEEMLIKLAGSGSKIVLAHYDFGFGEKEKDVAEAARLSPLIGACMAPGGVLISGQPLVGFEQVRGPETVAPDRYCFYKV